MDLRKLGRKPAKRDAKRLFLARYLGAALPAPPDALAWSAKITQPWGMMLNDSLGDCVFAGIGHAIQTLTAAAAAEITVPDPAILALYEKWAGYVPGNESTDDGYVEVDALNNWRAQGFDGHALTAYADLDVTNVTHWKQAIALLGGVYIGLNLPVEWQSAAVWDKTGTPGSWGGHAVWCPDYNAQGPVCVTWGKLQQITWAAASDPDFCDEAHALLSPDFIEPSKLSASGFDVDQLQADLEALAA
jgi:hypothetical protein